MNFVQIIVVDDTICMVIEQRQGRSVVRRREHAISPLVTFSSEVLQGIGLEIEVVDRWRSKEGHARRFCTRLPPIQQATCRIYDAKPSR